LAGACPPARKAHLVTLRNPEGGQGFDRALVLWFPGPGSATGEDLAEFHLHGGPSVVAAVTDALARLPGLRPAEPGEFTRRAFDQGKLDLAEVEGLADLLAAETEAQRRQAFAQMGGRLSRQVGLWRQRLITLLAHQEALLDFPEEDLPEDLLARLGQELADLGGEIAAALDDQGLGERLREGATVAVLGAPNAGKSRLVNTLAQRDLAIVSPLAGTTRDVIEVRLDLAGLPVTLLDTAGLRRLEEGLEAGPEDLQAHALIEWEGIARARGRAEEADLKLLLFDASAPDPWDDETLAFLDDRALVLLNKCDRTGAPSRADLPPGLAGAEVLAVSAKTEEGIPELIAALTERLGGQPQGEAPVITRLRHRQALEEVAAALVRAEGASLPDLMAEDLRLALRALGRITGQVDVEDLLDVIFRDFCIGK
jgi:tRNA modification GTPase